DGAGDEVAGRHEAVARDVVVERVPRGPGRSPSELTRRSRGTKGPPPARRTPARCNAPGAVLREPPNGARVRHLRQAALRRPQREPRQQQDEAALAAEPPAGARHGGRRREAAPRLHALPALGARAEGRAAATRRNGLTGGPRPHWPRTVVVTTPSFWTQVVNSSGVSVG